MNLLNQLFKITTHIFFVIIFLFFSTLQAKNFDKFNNGDKISNYFSGIILLNDEKYEESYKFLKKLDGLEDSHKTYSIKYLYSLVNSGNINQAFQYSKKIEKVNHGSFETDLIIGIYNLKKNKSQLATKYFLKASNRTSLSVLDNYISNSLYIWSQMDGLKMGNINPLLNRLDKRFENLKKIQKVFLNCFFNSSGTKIEFENLVSNEKTDFSRYNYFYANYLKNTGKVQGAKSIIQNSLKKYPRNLLLNQYKIDLEKSENNLIFNCNKK